MSVPAVLSFSASQVDTFESCPRKWFYGSHLGIRYPQHPSAALGERVHGRLEKYLLGEEPDWSGYEGEIAVSGIQHLPPPGTCIAVEKKDCAILIGGFRYVLRSDFVFLSPHHDRVIVGDHKTSSNIREYAKTPEILKEDFQALLYGYYWSYKEALPASALWVYYQTGKTKARRSEAFRVDFDDSDWTKLEERAIDRASQMTRYRSLPKLPIVANEIPGNREHCSAYGGCPYEGICGIKEEIDGMEIMKEEDEEAMEIISEEDLLSKLEAQAGLQPAGINAPEGDGGAPTAQGGTPTSERPAAAPAASGPTAEELFAQLSGKPLVTEGAEDDAPKVAPAAKPRAPAPATLADPPANALRAYERDTMLGVCIWALDFGHATADDLRANGTAPTYHAIADRAWVIAAERALDKASGRKPVAAKTNAPVAEKPKTVQIAGSYVEPKPAPLSNGYTETAPSVTNVVNSSGGIRASGEIRIVVDISDRLAAFLERLCK